MDKRPGGRLLLNSRVFRGILQEESDVASRKTARNATISTSKRDQGPPWTVVAIVVVTIAENLLSDNDFGFLVLPKCDP